MLTIRIAGDTGDTGRSRRRDVDVTRDVPDIAAAQEWLRKAVAAYKILGD